MSGVGGARVCPLCSSRGVVSTLKLYQLNENEAIYMCPSKQCPYPIGVCDPVHVLENQPVLELKQQDENTTPAGTSQQ